MKIINKKDKKENEYILVNNFNIECEHNSNKCNEEKNHLDTKILNEDNNIAYKNDIQDSLNHLQDNKEKIINDLLIDAKIDLLPSNFVIGYYEGMTMKGLKEYINGYVFKYFNAPNITSYKILKYNSGFIFEIHDGDYKKSYLNAVINEFNNGRNIVYVKTQHRIAKIIKNYSKIETYMLPEADNNSHPEAIFPEKATMKPIVTTAFGMIPFGLSIAFMGITSLFLSYIFKTILGKDEEVTLQTYSMELPSSYIEKLPLATETKYVDKVLYNKNAWTKEFKEIKTAKMIKAEQLDLALSKILTYQNFTNRCFTKSQSLDQCNDSNIFFDKPDFVADQVIKSVTMEKGLITVLLRENNDSIKYIPEIKENNLIWKIECSDKGLAKLCMSPNVTIKHDKKTEGSTIKDIDKVVPSSDDKKVKNVPIINLPTVTNSEKDVQIKTDLIKSVDISKKETTNKSKKVHEIIKDVESSDIIKTPKIDEVNKTLNKIEESSKPVEVINNVEKNLNFNNLPDNVVVEKK